MVHRWTGVPNRETTQRAKSVYLTILAMFCTNFSRTKPIISTILDLVVTLSLTVKTDCNNFLNRVLFKDINCSLLVMVVLALVTVKMLHWVPASPAALCLLPVVWWSAEKSTKSLHVHCTVVVIVFVYRLILEHRYYRYWENCSRHFNAEFGIEVSVRVLL